MRYSDEIIEEVRSSSDIVDVIGTYVNLQKKGKDYFGLCPFHNEKSPSFSVSQSKQMFYCFGCQAGGNVVSFVMQYENYSFQEAIQMLADRAGITLPAQDNSEETRKRDSRRAQLLEIQKEAAIYYHHILMQPEGAKGLEYLTGRQLSRETITAFGLGYAPAARDRLYRYLRSKGYSSSLLNESGLAKVEETGAHDRFWNRVMFPIMDVNNRVIGFGGRVMGNGEPKYLNSPETDIFDKSRNLYGLHAARRSKKDYFLICEGYMDVISMHQAGYTNAVASLGTAFTPGHANLIRRYTQNVILTYDSDGPGVKAALRAIPILREVGIRTKILNLKPSKDPDEFIKTFGRDAFQERIDQAQNSFLFELEVLQKEYNMGDPTEKTAFTNAVADRLTGFTEALERNNYIEAVARQFDLPFESLKSLVHERGLNGPRTASQTGHDTVKSRKVSRTQERENAGKRAQRILLTWIAEEPEVYSKIRDILSPADFSEELYSRIASELFELAPKGQINSAELLNHYLEEDNYEEAARVFQTRLSEALEGQQKDQAFAETVRRVKQNSFDRQIRTAPTSELQKILEEQKKFMTWRP